MRRINAANTAAGNQFRDANPGTGQAATSFNAEWCNGVQEEIVQIIEAGGIAPTAGAVQLYQALVNLQWRVGDTFITESETSPNTRWPWQTWTEEAGKMIVGYDPVQVEFNAIGKQGGSKTSAIAIANLPTTAMANFTIANVPVAHDGSTEDDQTINASSIVRGGGTALPVLNPYRVKHIWRRTA